MSAGLERGLGREPFLALSLGTARCPSSTTLPCSPSSDSTWAHTYCKVVSRPASPSLSWCHPHLADGAVPGEEPAGVCTLWTCCPWDGPCQPPPPDTDGEEPGAGAFCRHGQGRATSSLSFLHRAAQCCLDPSQESIGKWVNALPSSEMELRPEGRSVLS